MLQLVPGPPFVFGAFLVICALLVAVFIPDGTTLGTNLRTSSRRQSGKSVLRLVAILLGRSEGSNERVKCLQALFSVSILM
jgi:hypothetical protein